MSLSASTYIWKTTKQKGNALVVLLALADYADKDGLAWPKIESLAAKARMSTRTVYRVLNQLKASGDILIMEGVNHWTANHYQIVGLSDLICQGGGDNSGNEVSTICQGGTDNVGRGEVTTLSPINNSHIESVILNPSFEQPAPAPRAAAAGLVQSQSSDAVVDEKPNASVKVETVEAAKADIQEIPTPAAKPIPPVAASPLSHKWAGDDCDEPGMAGLRQFFTGCTDAELKQLVAKYGLAAIEQTIEAVRQLPNVENPPGLVKHKLLVQAVSTWTYPKKIDSQDAKNYVSGPYANFIRH